MNSSGYRHSERYREYLNGPLESQGSSVLRERGQQRALDLRDMFQGSTQVLPPPDQILVSRIHYTFQTALPLAFALGLPVVVTELEGQDMADRIAALDPCPRTALIVNHGNTIRDVFATLNYTGTLPDDVNEYGRFYRLERNAAGSLEITLANFYPFNDPGFGSPLPAPCMAPKKVIA